MTLELCKQSVLVCEQTFLLLSICLPTLVSRLRLANVLQGEHLLVRFGCAHIWSLLGACDEYGRGLRSNSSVNNYLQIVDIYEVFNNHFSVIDLNSLFLFFLLGSFPYRYSDSFPLFIISLQSLPLKVAEKIAVQNYCVVNIAIVVKVQVVF